MKNRERLDDHSLDIFIARANRYAQQQPNLARDILFFLLAAAQDRTLKRTIPNSPARQRQRKKNQVDKALLAARGGVSL